jgi:luciferase family oxidoreductase group 1
MAPVPSRSARKAKRAMKLSVLDQSPVPSGSTPADALNHTIHLARVADRLGYERYWIAEHHAMETLASPAPEILIARVAAETSEIRVGSGGVLLPHYSPLKVAEVFRMLHALYPGRIDLGLGRAPGSGGLEALALQRERTRRLDASDFPEQLTELLSFLHHDFPPENPFRRIQVSPEMPGAPEAWLLGSSEWSAAVAAQFGLPYAFAHFIGPEQTVRALAHYRANFRPSKFLEEPRVILTLGAVCADTEAEADRLSASTKVLIRRIRLGGERRPVPTPEEAAKELESAGEGADPLTWDASEWPRYAVGTAGKVSATLKSMAGHLHIEEIMILTVIHSHAARVRSYELLAESFGLTRRSPSDRVGVACREAT